jgi:hypothetical protein
VAWPAGRTAPQKQRLETRWHKPHTKALPLFCFSTAIASSPVFRQACLSSSSHTSLLPPAEGQLQSELDMSPGLARFLLSHFPASSHSVPTVGQLQSELDMSPGLSFFLLSHLPASSHNRPEAQGSELDMSPGLACDLLSHFPASSLASCSKGSEL